MAIAATPHAAALPSTDVASALASLQQAVAKLSEALQQLQAKLGTGAAAGAATIGGGPGVPTQHGCGCAGASGALGGIDQVGQAPPSKGDTAAGGAMGAPEAKQADGAPAGSGLGAMLVAEAKQHLGKKYVFGAEGPDTFDCSGLMQYAAKQLGIDLPRVARDQAKAGRAVDKGDLQPGDLVYFQGKGESDISHIGMFIGDGKFIHAPKPGDVVKVSSLSESYYQQTYRGARRIA